METAKMHERWTSLSDLDRWRRRDRTARLWDEGGPSLVRKVLKPKGPAREGLAVLEQKHAHLRRFLRWSGAPELDRLASDARRQLKDYLLELDAEPKEYIDWLGRDVGTIQRAVTDLVEVLRKTARTGAAPRRIPFEALALVELTPVEDRLQDPNWRREVLCPRIARQQAQKILKSLPEYMKGKWLGQKKDGEIIESESFYDDLANQGFIFAVAADEKYQTAGKPEVDRGAFIAQEVWRDLQDWLKGVRSKDTIKTGRWKGEEVVTKLGGYDRPGASYEATLPGADLAEHDAQDDPDEAIPAATPEQKRVLRAIQEEEPWPLPWIPPQFKAEVQQALALLPPDLRAVADFVMMMGWRVKPIARELGVDPKTVRNRWARVVELLGDRVLSWKGYRGLDFDPIPVKSSRLGREWVLPLNTELPAAGNVTIRRQDGSVETRRPHRPGSREDKVVPRASKRRSKRFGIAEEPRDAA